MKIAVCSDLHISVRDANKIFEDELRRFWWEVFLPYIKEHSVKDLIIAGDLLDNRRSIHIRGMNLAQEMLESVSDLNVYIIPGNHDLLYRGTLRPNSIEPLVKGWTNVRLFMEATEVELGGVRFLFVPWICDETEALCSKALKESTAQIAITHMDIKGSQSVPGVYLESGWSPEALAHFFHVLNGHIHTRSSFANVTNLGTQYQFSWSDYGQQKGFHIFDTADLSLSFIPNPNLLYEKFYFDDGLMEGVEASTWIKQNRHRVAGRFVKVVVTSRTDVDRFAFDKFLTQLTELPAHELSVIDTLSADMVDAEFSEEEFSQTKSTIQIIQEYVQDRHRTDLSKDVLMRLIGQLYTEALNRDVLSKE